MVGKVEVIHVDASAIPIFPKKSAIFAFFYHILVLHTSPTVLFRFAPPKTKFWMNLIKSPRWTFGISLPVARCPSTSTSLIPCRVLTRTSGVPMIDQQTLIGVCSGSWPTLMRNSERRSVSSLSSGGGTNPKYFSQKLSAGATGALAIGEQYRR